MRKSVFRAGVAFVLFFASYSSAGSCREAKLCCKGRDSACVVQRTSPNAIIEGPQDKPCYCDHACLKLGDCCTDFEEACGVVDCTVSSWGQWSACDSKCGPGSQTRSRVIDHPEENGGKHCPQLAQARSCQALNSCHRRSHYTTLRGVAVILPADLENPLDSREGEEGVKGYCVTFLVTRVSRVCKGSSSFAALTDGAEVCVRCQGQALKKAHGSRCQAEATRWKALLPSGTHCHGKWLRTQKTGPSCETPLCQPTAQFIFV